MINPKDLMLNNWVYLSEKSKYPMQVANIEMDMVYLNFEGNESDVFDGLPQYICPIPLTEEILQKNGFVKRKWIGHDNLFIYEYYGNKTNYPITVWYNSEFSVLFFGEKKIIKYVHELQNLLKIAGIEIEFKI